MNYRNTLKYFSLALGFSLVCPVSLCEAAEETQIIVESAAPSNNMSDSWPDLYKISESIAEQAVTDAGLAIIEVADAEPVPPRDQAFTQEELNSLFGDLPFTFSTGSLALDRLNGLDITGSNDEIRVFLSGGRIITRPSWSALEDEITTRFDSYEGDWSVYIKDLSSGKTMEINEHSMESASLIKLYIAGTIYEQFDLGNLSETDTIMNALNLMITVSDNESSNVLVRQLYDESGSFQDGLDVVNDFINRHGFTNTQQVNGIADPSLWVSDGRINMTSAADCGKLLEEVYNHTLVSHFNSFRFEVLLNKQEVNYKIPQGLPENVHISHKTGEVDDTENDAAIIYTPYGDYIFCILSTNLYDTGSAVDHIHEITALVYDYFTTDVSEKTEIVPAAAGSVESVEIAPAVTDSVELEESF